MKEFFQLYPATAWSIVSVMIALLAMTLLWEKIRWWWLNTSYSFPLFGGITQLSRDLNRDPSDSWFKAEITLCRDYKKFINIQDEHDFNEKISYLTKAGDLGRHDTPKWIWVLTFAMVFVEAMGFSYVLAGWTIPGASEHLQQTGAYGIAFLISVILVAFTHFAGHELYKSGQIKHARREWGEGGRKGKFTTGQVALAKPQEVDDSEAPYTQLANRVGTHPGYTIAIATMVFVAIVAVFATYVRGQVLEQQLHRETTGETTNPFAGANPYAAVLPKADTASQATAENKAKLDEASIERHGGWGTFIVLAFIFIFLQILGVLFGYRWGFAGRESEAAYRALGKGRYTSYADVREHYTKIADTAQAKLEQLQQRLMKRNADIGTDGMHAIRTFYEFMKAEQLREAEQREHERALVARRQHGVDLANAAATVIPAPPTTAPKPTAQPVEQMVPVATAVDDELTRLREQVTELEHRKQESESSRKQEEIAALKAKLAELSDSTEDAQ